MGTLAAIVLTLCVVAIVFAVCSALIKNFSLGLAAWRRVCGDEAFAAQVRRLLSGQPAEETPALAPAPTPAPAPVAAPRHEALSLLAVLQREARLLDFLKEPIEGYDDAQIGAAVRSVHKDSAAAVERMFGVVPLDASAEGAPVEVPAGYDPARYRLVGNVPSQSPMRGKLAHPGWKATRADVPAWTGRADAATVLAPTEVEF